ncbi:MAG: hypothetical protein ABW184_09885 [Sphingobium sp.]
MDQAYILVDERTDFDLDKRNNLVRLTMHSGGAKVRVAMSLHDMMMLATGAQRFCRDIFAQQQDAEVIPLTVIGRV